VGRKNGGKKNKILKVGGVLNLNDFRASLKNIIIFFLPCDLLIRPHNTLKKIPPNHFLLSVEGVLGLILAL
jgi:hypothetical protein